MKVNHYLIIPAVLFFFNFYPFYITEWFFPGSFVMGILWALIWFVILKFNSSKIFKRPNGKFTSCIFFSCCFFIFRYITLDEIQSLSYALFAIMGWVGVYLTINSFSRDVVVKGISKFMVIMVACSIIGFVLYTFGLLHPLAQHVTGDSEYGEKSYVCYGLFNTRIAGGLDQVFLRTSGWFDEPGSFSFVITLLVIYNLLHAGSTKVTNWLLYGGCITFSAAQLAVVFIYNIFKNFKFQRFIYILVLILTIWLLYHIIPNSGLGENIRDATFVRVENIINGTDASRDYDASKKAAAQFWITGTAHDNLIKRGSGVTEETIYFVIGQFGVIGILIYYLIIIYGMFINRKRQHIVTALFLLFALIYQRPTIYLPFFILLLYLTFYDQSREVPSKKLMQ